MPDTDLTFNTTAGQTVGREMLIAYLTPVSLTALMRRKRKSGSWLSKTMMSMPC